MQRLAAALGGTSSHSSEAASLQALSGIVWTPSMRRMYTLVDRSATKASTYFMGTKCAVMDASRIGIELCPLLSLFNVFVLYPQTACNVRHAQLCNQTGDTPEYVFTGVHYLVATLCLLRHSMQMSYEHALNCSAAAPMKDGR